MPSKHEGFGLPALEAMACGAAVIVSNTTSLPEVVGTPEALFDPHDPHSISEKLAAVLTNVGLRERLAAHGLARAQRFTWAQSARLAWTALEEVQSRTPPMSRPGAVLARKLRLAFVSPLPPDATGIADYARDLLPDLARHYDITLVNRSGTTSDTTLRALFPVISEARFANEAGSFPRIVYQIGNSEFHSKIVTELLQQFPGVAVLHDAYLSNIPLIAFLNGGGLRALVVELLESHGWGAVRALHFAAPAAVVRDFPCTLPVFRAALGVIQHSAHARDIAERHIGPEAAAMIRLVPHARASWPPMGRTTARSRLDLNLVQPVIVSLGMVAPTKRPTTVLRGWHIAFGQDNSARLAFVGPILPELASELRAEAERLGVGGRVTLTGRVDENTYRLWLEAADIAVQLRMGSRGETSGAVADAMGAGLPVIVSDHGSMAELPPGAVMLVEDNADCAAVGTALARLWSDAGLRAAIGQAAASHVSNELSPVRVAGLYRDAIEEFHALGAPARQLAALPDLPEFDLPEAAQALVHSFQTVARPRLLLDVSCIDDASETQCGIVRTLLTNPGDAWYADLIRLGDGPAHHDRRNAARLLGLPDHALPEPTLVGGPSDIVVLAVRHAPWPDGAVLELARLRREGARVVALLDGAWLPGAPGRAVTTALAIADAVLCRSHDEAALVMHWLDGGLGDRRRPLEIGLLPEPDQPSVGPKRAPGSVALLERPHAANVTSAHERLCALLTSGAPWPLRWLPRGVAYR